MAGGPGSYVLGAEERKEVLDVLDGGNLRAQAWTKLQAEGHH